MEITDNKVVTLDYTLKDDAGKIIDQSENAEFVYLHGARNIIPGLENALAGKTAGIELDVTVAPADGYGERDESMLQVVSKDMFESADQITVGQQFHAQGPDEEVVTITVMEINDDQITIDGNHPLAGVQLSFAVSIIDVRDASDEEMEHGHAHGPDGHHH
ncbi:MAG TPA: peptidylprolyl isomerase [Gammaproteobacteria bacterium]|nr:peptidylprolyl isomerase [Gammaproteobacteria bacterium]